MAMKSAQSAENTQKPMPGSTKRQIASRLRRAITHADNLVNILQDRSTTGAKALDDLEARAYYFMLKGGLDFEKGRWRACIQNYSVSQVVYTTLARSSKIDAYKDLLSGIVDPSIRYAAYQLKMPRTKALNEIVVESFPQSETNVRQEVEQIDPQAFSTVAEAAPTKGGPKEIPSALSWRSRKVKLEDANISQALGLSKEKEEELASSFKSFQDGSLSAKDFATAYEDVITTRQDAADATKTAIDELVAEGVDTGDARMQSLQITRTAVNYAVIEWRIGRNRVLCGASDDGLAFESEKPKQPLKPRKDGKPRAPKEESTGRKMSRLRERVALYDSILQSLDAVKELPGVMADTSFMDELDAKSAYFRALKCLAVGRSHAISDRIPDALALYVRALELADTAAGKLGTSTTDISTPPSLHISAKQLNLTASTLRKLVLRYRALADLRNSTATSDGRSTTPAAGPKPAPLIERLSHNGYIPDLDLTNLVNYPPKLRPVPVKPLFFDLAWNYIKYPGQKSPEDDLQPAKEDVQMHDAGARATNGAVSETDTQDDRKTQKRGWFGFGRS
jgi:signal recognition particle subunit SRP68